MVGTAGLDLRLISRTAGSLRIARPWSTRSAAIHDPGTSGSDPGTPRLDLMEVRRRERSFDREIAGG